jgi:hypothetical protein
VKLNIKELRTVLKGRHLITNGNKLNLLNRLERSDNRHANYRKTCDVFGGQPPVSKKAGNEELDEFMSDATAAAAAARQRNNQDVAASKLHPSSPSRDPISVEDASPSKDDAVMVDEDAEVLFPNASSNGNSDPPGSANNKKQPSSSDPPSKSHSYAELASKSPPSTVGTATTTESTVSSLKSPSYSSQGSVPDSLSGRILNQCPKRNVAIDGLANFIQFCVTPSQEKVVLPETHTYKGIVEIFGSLQKVDKQVTLFPIYEAEAGEMATPPIVDVNLFPSDLEALQMNYVSLDNPWDLKKVLPGQTDSKTGLEKKQKEITSLCY